MSADDQPFVVQVNVGTSAGSFTRTLAIRTQRSICPLRQVDLPINLFRVKAEFLCVSHRIIPC